MALIECPECKKQVSDKATSCPHCGYPINNENDSKLYSMIFVGLQKNANIFLIKSILEQVFEIPKNTINQLLSTPGSMLIDGVEQCNTEYLENAFMSYNCIVKFVPSETVLPNSKNSEWETKRKEKESKLHCPRCGSIQITTGQRGFSFWTGFIGANKTTNRCAKCGYSWQPK